MFRLKSLHQRDKRQGVEEHVEEAEVYERICIQSVHCNGASESAVLLRRSAIFNGKSMEYVLDPNPTCAGTSAAQAITFHAGCSSSNHSNRIMNSSMRVNSGNRKRYERILAGEKEEVWIEGGGILLDVDERV